MTEQSKPWPVPSDKPLTAEILRRLVHYDPLSGDVTWIGGRANRRNNGDVIRTTYDRYGHLGMGIGRRRYYLHSLIWLWMTGEWPSLLIDHVNGDPRDNRWANLRLATVEQNAQNRGKDHRNTSGFKGVYFDNYSGRWKAQITAENRIRHLGRFDTREEAAAAYQEAAQMLHGAFARAI